MFVMQVNYAYAPVCKPLSAHALSPRMQVLLSGALLLTKALIVAILGFERHQAGFRV